MPWTQAQNRLFRAAAHNPAIAKQHGLTQTKAAAMASEGVKKPPAKLYARALGKMP